MILYAVVCHIGYEREHTLQLVVVVGRFPDLLCQALCKHAALVAPLGLLVQCASPLCNSEDVRICLSFRFEAA